MLHVKQMQDYQNLKGGELVGYNEIKETYDKQ